MKAEQDRCEKKNQQAQHLRPRGRASAAWTYISLSIYVLPMDPCTLSKKVSMSGPSWPQPVGGDARNQRAGP